MPIFLAPLVPALIAWGTRAAAVYGLSRLFSENSIQELEKMLTDWVVSQIAARSGLVLDPDAPFTDASMAGAVSQKIGIPLRSLKDHEIIKEDLDSFAVGMIQQKTGYVIRSLQNVATLKADLIQIAGAELSGRLGIPAGVMPGQGEEFNPEAVKANLLAWAKAELLTKMSGEVEQYVTELSTAGGVVAMAEQLNSRLALLGSKERVTARQIAVNVANRMATGAVVDYQKVAAAGEGSNRRKESLKMAQRKFRAAHGNRQQYIPLGRVGVINDAGPTP